MKKEKKIGDEFDKNVEMATSTKSNHSATVVSRDNYAPLRLRGFVRLMGVSIWLVDRLVCNVSISELWLF